MVLAIVLKNRKKKRKKKKECSSLLQIKFSIFHLLIPKRLRVMLCVFVDLFCKVELAISPVDLCSMQQSFCVFVQEDYLLKRG